MDNMEFYRKHRPTEWSEVLGQDAAVKMLRGLLKNNKLPHVLLLTGPSGCGKTTVARILKEMLKCGDKDFYEMNGASSRGIDDIRDIRNKLWLRPQTGKCRLYLIDEVHGLTSQAQDALLKVLEDTPSHVYFILATNEAQKLKRTIVTRCTEVKLSSLSPKDLTTLLNDVAGKENFAVDDEEVEKIVEIADGSARKALVILNQISNLDDKEDRLKAIMRSDMKSLSIMLCRAIVNPKTSWSDVAKIISTIDDDAETVRRHVLGYAAAILLKGGSGKMAVKMADVIDRFRDNYFDCGKPGLVLSCWEVLHK